jgi:cytosine/adenosine deaminase-related metal-dependent hydrolase
MNPHAPEPAARTPSRILRLDVAAAADDRGLIDPGGPVSLLFDAVRHASNPGPVSPGELLAIGRPAEIDRHPAAAGARRVDRTGSIALPAFVNAHTHLDLTAIGPLPLDPAEPGAFAGWLGTVVDRRAKTADAIRDAVAMGVDRSLAGGVVAVGDVAGCPPSGPTAEPFAALAASPLVGVSGLEFFAIGTRADAGLSRAMSVFEAASGRAERSRGVRLGIHPHAPYSVAEPVYRALEARLPPGVHRSTHLAESLDERRCIAESVGPQLAFLEKLGLVDRTLRAQIGRGLHPIEHLAPTLRAAHDAGSPYLCAHVNDCPADDLLAILAETDTRVAYCPRASAYFGNPGALGPHRYRDMLSAGITVALGTDSILNCPFGTDRLTPLDDARLLRARDGTDARTLLAMCTTHGCRAVGIDTDRARFAAGGAPLGVVLLPAAEGDPLAGCFDADTEPELLRPHPA